MKNIVINVLIIMGAILLVIFTPYLLLSYSLLPYPENSETLSLLINNATAPVVSILTLIGVFLAYFSQQKNHREQMIQLKFESHYNFINDLYNKISEDLYTERENGLRLQHSKIITLLNTYNGSGIFPNTFDKNIEEVKNRISKYRTHLENYEFLANQIKNSELMSMNLYKIFVKKIISDLKLLENKKLSEICDAKLEKKENPQLAQIKKIIVDYNNEVSALKGKMVKM